MTRVAPRIDLGKFRIFYNTGNSREPTDAYVVQQRAIICLNEDLVRIERPEDYTILCNEQEFMTKAGRRPSPLQYFLASIGVCMFTQLSLLAAKARVAIEHSELDLRMSYDLNRGSTAAAFPPAGEALSYFFSIKSCAPVEKVIRIAQLADKACHTVNSMRKRLVVSGKFLLNGRELTLGD